MSTFPRRSYRPIFHTDHYVKRCLERRLLLDCAEQAYAYGRACPGRSPDEIVYRIDHAIVLEAAKYGLNLSAYEDIAVPLHGGKCAVTAFKLGNKGGK